MSHIALVEDDESLALMLSYNFEARGMRVAWLKSGADALQALVASRPDVIILDWNLPGLSGIEILRQLRKMPCARRIPVIMLTGRLDPADRIRALETGADLFLPKPFSVIELLDAAKTLIAGSTPAGGVA